jgi:hypothetical protein
MMDSNFAFAGSNMKWFVGQVVPNWNEYNQNGTWKTAWGNRVKVRIPALHSKDGSVLPDSKLPWAIVAEPTTHGNSSSGSVSLIGGEWVRGYFLDSDSPNPQIPVISEVLPINFEKIEIGPADISSNIYSQSTEFKTIDRFITWDPGMHQTIGGMKPQSQAKPTTEEFQKSKTANK